MSNALSFHRYASGTALLVPTIEGYPTKSPASFFLALVGKQIDYLLSV